MPLNRDDSDERIARLEKMMEEARAKTSADPAIEPPGATGDAPKPSPQAKVVIRRPARKSARRGSTQQ
jgi:hypothetical protein